MTANAVSLVQRQTPVIRGAAASPRTVLRTSAGLFLCRAVAQPSPLCAPPGARAALVRAPALTCRQGRLRPSQGVRYAHSGDVCRLTQLSRPTHPVNMQPPHADKMGPHRYAVPPVPPTAAR